MRMVWFSRAFSKNDLVSGQSNSSYGLTVTVPVEITERASCCGNNAAGNGPESDNAINPSGLAY